MEQFMHKFTNSIMNLFLDESNFLTNRIDIQNKPQIQYVKNVKKDYSLFIKIYLNPKNPSFHRRHEIVILEISHQKKNQSQNGFQEYNNLINDTELDLQINLNMLLKLIISFSFLSPYVNFCSNQYSKKISLIRKKFIINYSIEEQQNFETLKEKKLNSVSNEKIYSLKKIIENSNEKLNINYQLLDNINELVLLIDQNEVSKSKSSKGLRNRFLSEETGYEFCAKSIRKASWRFRSTLSIRQNDQRNPLQIQETFLNKKPYELVDEVILKNALNDQNENEESLFIRHPYEVEIDLKSPDETNNSSSFFTDTNFSIRSKNKEKSNKKIIIKELDRIPTVDNIYDILKKTKIAFQNFQCEKKEIKEQIQQVQNNNLRKQIIFRFPNQLIPQIFNQVTFHLFQLFLIYNKQ